MQNPAAALLCNKRIALVEGNEDLGTSFVHSLQQKGMRVTWMRCSERVRTVLSEATPPFDYAIIDAGLDDGAGVLLLPLFTQLKPKVAIALVSDDVSQSRALEVLRMGHVLLPKPRDISQISELLGILLLVGSPRIELPRGSLVAATDPTESLQFNLGEDGLQTPQGTLLLSGPHSALLHVLFQRGPPFTSAKDLAREFNRRDAAGAVLVRRRIADARRALGPYRWLIDSMPKHGYRIHPRVATSVRTQARSDLA
jgi:DNA-binding response OmpR family regulator